VKVLDPVPRKCECGEYGFLTHDPYREDLYGELVEVVLCDDCYFNSCQEI
jgi:hypothetical protein